MNPIVVIGAGGSGKWIATDVKLAITDHRNRELLRTYGDGARERPDWDTLPSEVRVLTVDVSRMEAQPVARTNAFHEEFSLDYADGSAEFAHIGSEYGRVIESVAKGRPQDFPLIASWLSQKDAACYDLGTLGSSADGGAGQLRQLGRASLFLGLQGKQELAGLIRDAIADVSKHRTSGARVSIFVCGSLAGGTGSGTLWDIAALTRHYANEVLRSSFDIIGLVVLPATFSTVSKQGAVEPVRMAANTYAGLRELSRLMNVDQATSFTYSAGLDIKLKEPIFTVAYLVEGSRPAGYDLAGEEPRYGTYPTIADSIMLHAATTVDFKQILAERVQHPDGVFSTVGAVQWIFPAEEIVQEGGNLLARLSLEKLRWGRRITDDTAAQEAHVQANSEAITVRDRFFESSSSNSSALIRFVHSFLRQARKPQLLTGAMSQHMRFNDKDRDHSLPTLNLPEVVEVAPLGSKGDPTAVKRQTEDLITKVLGGEGDALSAGRKTVHAVLNHYLAEHEAHFRVFLSMTMDECLNDTSTGGQPSARPAGLLRAAATLESIADSLRRFHDLFVEVYADQCRVESTNTTVLDRASEELAKATKQMLLDEGMKDRFNNRGEQTDYVRLAQWVYDLKVQNLVHSTIVDIVNRCVRTIGEFGAEVNSWLATIRDDITALENRLTRIQVSRREAARIRSRRYLSEPGDALESELILTQLGIRDNADPTDSAKLAEINAPLRWTWEAGELFMVTPSGASEGSRRTSWRREALPAHVQRCVTVFEPIRKATIWEAFTLCGYNVSAFRAELAGRSAPITVLDLEEQQRYPLVDLVPKTFVLAAWEEAQSEDPADSPRRFSQQLREELGNSAVRWNDPHVLLAVGKQHLVKFTALTCVNRMKIDYERILTGRQPVEGTERRLPLHLFPGESLAAELELSSIELLDEEVVIPPQLVAMLDREEVVLDFAMAVAYGHVALVQSRRRAESYWAIPKAVLEDGREDEVRLGDNVMHALSTFISPSRPGERQGRASVDAALSKTIDEFPDIESYTKDLRERARGQLVPDADLLDDTVRTGFDRALRMLIRRRAEQLG
jgi:tubulin-like protein